MKGTDWISERMVFGALVILGYLLCIGAAAYFPMIGASRDIVTGAVGALGTAVGMVVQSVFRTDKIDKQNAATLANLSQAVGSAGNG